MVCCCGIYRVTNFLFFCLAYFLITASLESYDIVETLCSWCKIIGSCVCCIHFFSSSFLPLSLSLKEVYIWVLSLAFPDNHITELVRAEWGLLEPLTWWWAGQEGSGFLSVLPPAVSPVCPEGRVLIGRGWGVKHRACWEGMAVSWCGVSPVSQPCLWSTIARKATGKLTTLELWLLIQRKSPNCSLNSLA